ncbi:MAG: hypothetical protein GX616_16380, partial [Planctomycetes bacterium]|nr:hypothetical protein [Planctomycetota bacterium]
MAFSDLQSFVAELERLDQLRRVKAEVDPILVMAEIADRMMKSPCPEGPAGAPAVDRTHGGLGGRALLFEQVRGSSMPVLINAFGSYARIRLALGCRDLDDVGDRLRRMIKPEMPGTFMEKLKKLPELVRLASFAPKPSKRGICQEVVRTNDADLLSLPIPQCWPSDGNPASEPPEIHPQAEPIVEAEGAAGRTGRYITLGGVITQDPDSGVLNMGMYRVQVFGPKLAAVHWHVHHDGARIYRRWAARGEKMPMAIALGGEP